MAQTRTLEKLITAGFNARRRINPKAREVDCSLQEFLLLLTNHAVTLDYTNRRKNRIYESKAIYLTQQKTDYNFVFRSKKPNKELKNYKEKRSKQVYGWSPSRTGPGGYAYGGCPIIA